MGYRWTVLHHLNTFQLKTTKIKFIGTLMSSPKDNCLALGLIGSYS